VRELAEAQPDFGVLLAEASISSDLAECLRASGVRYVALITETWCPDSLHAVPLLVCLQEATPGLDVRVWKRSTDPALILRIASEPPGSVPPAVPHVAFRDAAFREIGHFRERPESLTAYLEEESRNFRIRLRMQERDRVRRETLAGLLAAASPSPPHSRTNPD
jgi:hypothetical protein